MVKKIYVNKSDEATLVIERVIDAEATKIVLSIPRYSRFAQSESNFHLLKKEADALGKEIVVESVDERALELSAASSIEARNPFFDPEDNRVSDIVPRHHSLVKKQVAEGTLVSKRNIVRPCPDPEDCDDVSQPAASDDPRIIAEEIEAKFGPEPKPRSRFWGFVMVLIILGVSGAMSFVALKVLPRASVTIVREKTDFAYANIVAVDKSIRSFDVSGMRIPGQIFIEKRNATLTFPASGKKYISEKASGRLTIYNSYSHEPQKLVASTRFLSPDGKIFRLASAVVVPGAKIVDGKIIPSSIEAEVVADQPGAEYNLSPTEKWSIPGFKGTPRYAAFYATSPTAMAGGYVGEVPYPSDEDMRKAKVEIAKVLESGAKTALLAKIPADFKMVENAFLFTIGKQNIKTEPNPRGEFSVYAEGEVAVMAFREPDLYALFDAKIAEKGSDLTIKNKTLSYGSARVDMVKGLMAATVDFKATLVKKIDSDDLKSKLANKSKPELSALFLSIPGIETATINLWPRWVKRVPAASDKLELVID
jgi:hypothetical protein